MKYKNIKFYTVKEFAKIMNMHVNTVYNSIKAGNICVSRMGGGSQPAYRIPETEIRRSMDRNGRKAFDNAVEQEVDKRLKGEGG